MPNIYMPMRLFSKSKNVVGVCAALLAMQWPGCGWAQQAMPEASGATATFPISGFDVTGDNPLSAQESARVLAPFIGPQGNLVSLQKATAALESELKAKGFDLHRVALPPQEVGAKVTLTVVKFVIGKVTVEGVTRYNEANIRASVPELQEGVAPNFKTLAIQTAIANESQGKQVQVSLKESEEAEKIDVKLVVKESKPWNFSASLSNTGSDATGKDRLSLVGGHSNVFDLDHQFAGAYTTSIERSSDVKQLGLNYRIPLYRQGGVIGLSYTNSDVVGSFGTFNSTGAGQTLGVNYSHYLPPEGGRRSYLTVGLDEKVFNTSKINSAPLALGQPDKISSRPLSLGYNARVESDTAVWGYNTELALNLPGGSGNNLMDYQNANAGPTAPDTRISTVNWTALRGGANYMSAFTAGWLWSVRGQFQYSPQALISGEQFGLGGATSVRGTGERPISGDSGVFASLEATTPELQPGLRAFGFLDAGSLYNTSVSAIKPTRDQLVSTGLGLRYASGAYGVTVDWGYILTGSVLPFTSGSGIPQSGDQKLHLNFTARF
jgi:hemolysin activation/secretion protein